MKTLIDLKTWPRTPHFEYFTSFDRPYYNFTTQLNITKPFQNVKENKLPVFGTLLFSLTEALNSIENFRYGLEGGEVFLYDMVHPAYTILNDEKLLDFCSMDHQETLCQFVESMPKSYEKKVTLTVGEKPQFYVSVLPWFDFTSASHAMPGNDKDAIPRFYFGKILQENSKVTMSFDCHVHHGFVDGYHVGLLFDKFMDRLRINASSTI